MNIDAGQGSRDRFGVLRMFLEGRRRKTALPSIASGQRPLAPPSPARAEFDCRSRLRARRRGTIPSCGGSNSLMTIRCAALSADAMGSWGRRSILTESVIGVVSSKPLSMSHLGLSLCLSSQKQIPQHNGVVVDLVVSREHERDRALSRQCAQLVELSRMLVDLRGVPAAKLRPTLRVVTEPFSQGCARRDILGPL